MSKTAFDNLAAAVSTINTPMPVRIDEDTLLAGFLRIGKIQCGPR